MYDSEIKKSTDTQKEIKSVAEYLKVVSSISKKDSVVLYRGHAGDNWELTPAVGRRYNGERKLLKYEEAIFLDFKRQYHLYADDRPATDMDILFLAQHHELPTRLLDWTYNPLIALLFACQEATENTVDGHRKLDGYVFYIAQKKQKDFLKEGHKLDNDIFGKNIKTKTEHYFIVPDYTNRRFLNQKGMFIWFKNPDVEFKDYTDKILIKEENKKNILQELVALGVTKAFVLPTLDNLCYDIKTQYAI